MADIAHGGMAAVYAVSRSSIGGFDKLLAMKVLLPGLREEAFVTMFLDEARIVSRIHNPHVVQVFDLGEEDEMPFLVMELLRGRTLGQLRRFARERKQPLPHGLVRGVLVQAAQGLHAAHETIGPDGEPLGIVHRDVNPQNIHVGYDGQTKIVDFGVARARGRLSKTRTGEVKGKLSYLAPEQIHKTGTLDRRVDVWALGVTAYELLAGVRLFRAADDASTMWNVLEKKVAPLDPSIEAADVVMRCLHRAPEARFATIQTFGDALSESGAEVWSIARIAKWMNEHFADERRQEDARLREPPTTLPSAPTPTPTPARDSEPTVQSATEVPSTRRTAIGVFALALGCAAALAFVIGASGTVDESPETGSGPSRPSPPTDSRASEPLSAPRPANTRGSGRNPDALPRTRGAPPDELEPVRRTVRIHIEPSVVQARVNGIRHDERPLTIEIGDTPPLLELSEADGRSYTRTIGAEDDGQTVRMPTHRRRRSDMRTSAPRMNGTQTAMGRLLGSPY
ncbi:MAG: serine/threonine-protein kinase [Myxococcota bacterium]